VFRRAAVYVAIKLNGILIIASLTLDIKLASCAVVIYNNKIATALII
jgi:hypothetical protein